MQAAPIISALLFLASALPHCLADGEARDSLLDQSPNRIIVDFKDGSAATIDKGDGSIRQQQPQTTTVAAADQMGMRISRLLDEQDAEQQGWFYDFASAIESAWMGTLSGLQTEEGQQIKQQQQSASSVAEGTAAGEEDPMPTSPPQPSQVQLESSTQQGNEDIGSSFEEAGDEFTDAAAQAGSEALDSLREGISGLLGRFSDAVEP